MRFTNYHLFGISFVELQLLNPISMPIIFTPNIVFTSFIKIEGRVHEFNFRKKNEAVFEADSTDARGNRVMFELCKESENWTITSPNLPAWVRHSQDLVIDAIAGQ